MSLGVLPASFLEYECFFGLGRLFNSGEDASLAYGWSSNARVILCADQKDILEFKLCADLVGQEFAHDAVVLAHLVLEALDADDGKDLFGVSRQHYSFLGVVDVEDFILLGSLLHGVEKTLLPLDLLSEQGLLPLVHNTLVLLVHVVLVIHSRHALLVNLSEKLTERCH